MKCRATPTPALRWQYLALVALTIGAFLPVFWLNFLRYDDPGYVTQNPVVTEGLTWRGLYYAFTAIVSGNWHPLTILSHQLDVTLFGLHPAGHHGVNLLFHVLNAMLLFHLLLVTMPGGTSWRSLMVAALFSVHPLRVESVAWVAERKDVLSTFFMFLAMNAYVGYVRDRKAAHYGLVIAFLALALLAKPMPVTLPFLLILLDYWPLRRVDADGCTTFRRSLAALVLEKAPLFALSAASCVATLLTQHKAGAALSNESIPFTARLANAAISYAAYLGKMLLPIRLGPQYPHPGPDVSTALASLCAIALAVATASVVIAGPRRPYLFVGWFWYMGMLVPVIGLVQVGAQAMADRYTYVPLVGIFLALVWWAADTWFRGKQSRRLATVLGTVCLITLAGLTFRQTLYWRNNKTLFTHALAVSPRNSMAHYILGLVSAGEGDYANAVDHLTRAVELAPYDPNNMHSLGVAFMGMQRHEEAIPWLQRALEYCRRPADLADIHDNLGMALRQAKRIPEAEVHFQKALGLNPNHVMARVNLGLTQGLQNKPEEALATLEEAVRLAPDHVQARFCYGLWLMNARRFEDSVEQFEMVLRLQPDHQIAAQALAEARRLIGSP